MNQIHPTAIVNNKAKLGNDIVVGPYSIIEEDVEIGDNCFIGPHVCIYNGARIGNRVKIYQGASIANVPQDLKFKPETKTYFYVGDDSTIREFVTLHRGTEAHGFSKIGKNCLFMAYSHVAHDCEIGNNVIVANSVQIAGHCTIEDFVIIGGVAGVHQFSKIGKHSMIAACTMVNQDVPPFIITNRNPERFAGLNVIGLRRRGFSNEDINVIKDVYRILYNSGLNISQAKIAIKEKYSDNLQANTILEFINNSSRGIIRK